MPRHHHAGLGIAVAFPEGWQAVSTLDFPLLVLAPETDGYRSTLGFSRSQAPATPEVVQRVLAASRAEQEADYPGFVEQGLRQRTVGGHPAWVQTYVWQPPSVPQPFWQWFGLVMTPSHGLVEFNGATLQSLAEPLEEAMFEVLDSVQFV